MSTQVSNPYSFNIIENKIFNSLTLNSEIPSGYLYDVFREETYLEYRKTISITVPKKITILCVETYLTNSKSAMLVQNTDNEIVWAHQKETKYIGVTPNKTYNLYLYTGPMSAADSGLRYLTFRISYSKTINNNTPDVQDY